MIINSHLADHAPPFGKPCTSKSAAVQVRYVVHSHTLKMCKEGQGNPLSNWKDTLTFQYQYILKTSEEQTYSIHIWHRPAGTGDLKVEGNRVTKVGQMPIYLLFSSHSHPFVMFHWSQIFHPFRRNGLHLFLSFCAALLQQTVQIFVVALILHFASEYQIMISQQI